MATVSGGTTSERFGFVQRHGQELGVSYLCSWLGVSRSGYYDWLKRQPSRRAREDVELSQQIVDIHIRSRETYGSPQVHRSLKDQGIHVGGKRVARLMRDIGIKGRVVTVTRRAPKLRRFQQTGENLRLHRAPPTRCDEQWVADITYIKVGSQYQYLVTIMDVYSRRILGRSLNNSRTVADVLPLLKRVIARRQTSPGLIFHTDRGIEFMAYAIQEELERHGLLKSYNRLGHCTDNAHMESFYHSLKGELIYAEKYETVQQIKSAVLEYIEVFYNRLRRHSALGYISPAEFERNAALAA